MLEGKESLVRLADGNGEHALLSHHAQAQCGLGLLCLQRERAHVGSVLQPVFHSYADGSGHELSYTSGRKIKNPYILKLNMAF
jgi:hypothetical protein